MNRGCDARLRNRKTGRIRHCGEEYTPIVCGTAKIPRTKAERLRRGGQPKQFCEAHGPFYLKREVSIIDGRPRTGRGRVS